MSDLDALLAAILEYPSDDLPRLIFADWLDENGESERGEFIRVQCKLGRLRTTETYFADCDSCSLHDDPDPRIEHAEDCPWAILGRRRRELESLTNSIAWFTLPGTAILWTATDGLRVFQTHDGNTIGARTSRGFISHITLSWADFQAQESKLLWWQPRKCDMPDCHNGLQLLQYEGPSGRLAKCSACRGTGEIPGATMPCPDCDSTGLDGIALINQNDLSSEWEVDQYRRTWRQAYGYEHPQCKTCSGSGRIPRPMPATAQPITTVTLTTWPDLLDRISLGRAMMGREDGIERMAAELHRLWPSVETWHLPTPAETPLARGRRMAPAAR